MPRGYRCVILAAFGWLILAASPSPKSAAQSEQTKRSANVELSLETIAGAQNKIAKNADSGVYQKPCNPSEDNRASDLCAQWQAAVAARDAARWAMWSLVVGLVGAVGIVIALLLTRQSNKIARDTAFRQLRPYITVKSLDIENPQKATITLVNSGATPAHAVQIIKIAARAARSAIDGISAIPSSKWADASMGVIGPNCEFAQTIEIDPVGSQLQSHMAANDEVSRIVGEVRYLDGISPETHFTRFRYELEFRGANAFFSPTNDGNSAT